MGCTSTVALTGIAYDCADIPVGGLAKVFLARKQDTTLTFSDDDLTAVVYNSPTDVVELEFNNKDAYSNFTDVKTVDPTGSIITVPTISIEFPKMTKEKRDELNAITVAGLDLIAWVETAAGTQHCVGEAFGLYAQSVNGQSGTGRSEKNVYQLVLTGEETNLAFDASAVWTEATEPV